LKLDAWHRPLAALMLKSIGLPLGSLGKNFDETYVQTVARLVESSSMSHAVLLAQDEVYSEDGTRLEFGSFHVPNDYLFEVCRRFPQFLPAVSIHPARKDALDELERCIGLGAVMVKLLPNCHNVNCNDRRYQKFWERMAEANLPLLAHTGGEHTVPVYRKEYANPRILQLPLECGVKVVAAHCATKSGLWDPEYFFVLAEMIAKFPNLYADISAFNVPMRGRHTPHCLKEPLASRMLHGSDFPVPVSGLWSWLRGFISWKDYRAAHRTSNLIERDYLLKKAAGFAPETFTRVWELFPTRTPTVKTS
jgi:hypothetical protein